MDRRTVGLAAVAIAAGAIAAGAIAVARPPHGRDDPPSSAPVTHPPDASRTIEAAAPSSTVPLVDLVHRTAAHVSVSSDVHNLTDLPAHLVDGRTDTAWQSKTGDLVGALIKFDVPPGARVTRIGIVAGFDATSDRWGDLFFANYRIARLNVFRAGVKIGDWRVDPSDRRMQYFELDAAGGDYLLEVAEVTAGTRSGWRELCVSELVVLGDPGAAPLRTEPLLVTLIPPAVSPGTGSPLATIVQGPVRDFDSLCRVLDAAACPVDKHLGLGDDPRYLELADVADEVCGANHVYLRTASGWYRLGIATSHQGCGDPESGIAGEIESASVQGGAVRFRLRSSSWIAPLDPSNPTIPGASHTTSASEQTYACREVTGKVECVWFRTATATLVKGDGEDVVRWKTTGLVVVTDAGVASMVPSDGP